MDTSEPIRQRPTLLEILTVLAAVLVVHLPMLGLFLWGDDFTNLNLAYRLHEAPLAAFGKVHLFFRPTMLYSMFTSYSLFADHAMLYNLVTLGHHLLNVLLLHLLVHVITGRRRVAAVVALLFGTTPLASEATLWTGARADSMLLGLLLGLLLYLSRGTSGTAPKLVVGCFMLAAMGTKESWLVLPPVALLFLVIVTGTKLRTAIAQTASGFALAVLYGLWFLVLPSLGGNASPLDYSIGGSSWAPLMKVGALSSHFLYLDQVMAGQVSVRALGFIAAAVLCLLAAWQKNRAGLFGLALMLLAMVPTLHILPHPSRFNYAPLVGFWVAFTTSFGHIFDGIVTTRPRLRRAAEIATAAAVAGIVLYQAWLVRLEIADYETFSHRHRMIAQLYADVAHEMPAEGLVIVVDRSLYNGPVAFQRAAAGLPKNVYPRPHGLWYLVNFDHLANFCGHPFEHRYRPVPAGDLDDRSLSDAAVVVFNDSGFAVCRGCSEKIAADFATTGQLPPRTSAFEVDRVR